jgi:phosphoglycerate kinase
MNGLDSLEVAGKRVFLRADLNVPLDGAAITDDGRIRASLPTIQEILVKGGRLVICAHLGRPSGASYADRAAGGPSLAPVAARLAELLGRSVPLAGDVAGPSARALAAGLAGGEAMMLENIRFEPDETSKDDAARGALANRLAALAEVYVGDGFGALHRKHASVYDVPALLPHAAGELVQAEVAVLHRLTEHPARPYVVVLGGAKPSDKLGVIGHLLSVADRILIGGGMSYTFLKAQGYEVGNSLLEADKIADVTKVMAAAAERGVDLVLPVDLVGATEYAPDADHEVYSVAAFPADREGMDMGPATRELYAAKLADAATVFWNGPVGVFEFPAFAAGTRAVAEAVAALSGMQRGVRGASPRVFTVVGGGDSAAAVRRLGIAEDRFSHISTGGGASLEYLEGTELPGLAALESAA